MKRPHYWILVAAFIWGCSALSSEQDQTSVPAAPSMTQTLSQPTPSPAPTIDEASRCALQESQIIPADFQVESTFAANRMTFTDVSATQPEPIIVAGPHDAVEMDARLTAEPQWLPTQNGADLRVNLRNSSTQPLPLGRIRISDMRLGPTVTAYDLRQGTEPYTLRRGAVSQQIVSQGFVYPNDLYSPVALLQNSRYTVGISLLYPVLEYQHAVKVYLVSPPGDPHWEVFFDLDGTLPAGEERQYTVAIRIVPRAEHFMKALLPYRNYFRALYGGVRYTRDPRPIAGLAAAGPDSLSADNPFGFNYSSRRPDLHGWGPWAQQLTAVHTIGFQRAMFWAPTGLYYEHRNFNYPFQFMTHMREWPNAMNTLDALRSVPQDDFQVGYWWGNSGTVMFNWDEGYGEGLDPQNPEHVRRAFAELDMAVSLGATMIGLDAFGAIPDYKAFGWLQTMQARAPGVRFIVEETPSDIIHLLAPSFAELHDITREHVLADFLLPGHETWADLRYDILLGGRDWWTEARRPERMALLRHAADLGYVPLPFMNDPIDATYSGKESWTWTIPAELRECTGNSSL